MIKFNTSEYEVEELGRDSLPFLFFRPSGEKIDVIARILEIETASNPDPWSLGKIAVELSEPRTHCFVIVEKSFAVCGFLIIRVLDSEGEILEIAIDPKVRGRGLGRYLLTEVLAKPKFSFTKVDLEVRAGNVVARSLYRSCGFQEVGIRKGYYANPAEDAVLMSWVGNS